MYYPILYYTILYYTILYYPILYYTILYYTILYYTMQHSFLLYVWVVVENSKRKLCAYLSGGDMRDDLLRRNQTLSVGLNWSLMRKGLHHIHRFPQALLASCRSGMKRVNQSTTKAV